RACFKNRKTRSRRRKEAENWAIFFSKSASLRRRLPILKQELNFCRCGFSICCALAGWFVSQLSVQAQHLRGSEYAPEELVKVLAAGTDVWVEAAVRQKDGPSYAFFEKLRPPPRYVHEIGRASCRERV